MRTKITINVIFNNILNQCKVTKHKIEITEFLIENNRTFALWLIIIMDLMTFKSLKTFKSLN